MAILVTDSTVDDADAYFATRLNSEVWTGSDDAQRKAGLVTAANLLNTMEWNGRPATIYAAFPRFLEGERIARTPTQMLYALYEEAIHLMANPGLMIEEDGVESIVLGPIELTKLYSPELIPKIVRRYIAPYTAGSGLFGGPPLWWRAN